MRKLIKLNGANISVSWKEEYWNDETHVVVHEINDLRKISKELKKQNVTFWVKKTFRGYNIYIKGTILSFTNKKYVFIKISG